MGKTCKKGRLTQVDKYIIQGMVSEKMSAKSIATQVNRSDKCVQQYIDNELDNVINHVVQASLEKFETENQELQNQVKELEKQIAPDNSFRGNMINETEDKKVGVSVMTKDSSKIGEEESEKNSKTESRQKIKDSIYNIKEGKMEADVE